MKPERSPEYELDLIRIRWAAYKTIREGGKYSIGSKEIYDSVRKRLKKMLDVLGKPELIENFKCLYD